MVFVNVSGLFLLFSTILLLLLFGGFAVEGATGTSWNYEFDDLSFGPLGWGNIEGFGECFGTMQSPINVDYYSSKNGFIEFSDELELLDISKNNGKTFLTQWNFKDGQFIYHFKAENTGSSIKLSPIDSKGNSLSGSDDSIARLKNIFGINDFIDSPSEFCFDSLHFHWGEYSTDGSEHTINGKQYPAEIHFVHYNCNFNNLNDALNGLNSNTIDDKYILAVVGFLFEIDDDASDDEISGFLEIIQDIDKLSNSGDSTNLLNVNLLGSFIPYDMEYILYEEYNKIDLCESNFWYYLGSLTTPGCNEIVRWHVFDYKLKITNNILNNFRLIGDNHGGKQTNNWRPIQNNVNDLFLFKFQCDMDGDRKTSGSSSRGGKRDSSSSDDYGGPGHR